MIGIYVRVSTEDQAKKGYSLEDQLHDCRKKAGEGAQIKEYIDDGITGEVLDRPALTLLRADVRDGLITKVICLDPDRWSRKLMNQLIVTEEIEKKAALIFVNGEYKNTPEGRLFYQMRGAISEFEKAKINERMSRGRRQKARKGKVVRDYQVYGYDFDTENNMFTINPYESEVVKLIFRLFTSIDIGDNNIPDIKYDEEMGEQDERRSGFQGINGIAKFLTEMKIPTKKDVGIWHRQVVRQILMNRAYIGEFFQNKWNTEGMLGNKFRKPEERIQMKERPKDEWILVPCPPIIKKEVFDYAQKLLQESRRRWAGKSKRQYLLSGLVRCGNCGNTMTGVNYKHWGKDVLVYTDFKSTSGAKFQGCKKRIRVDELDKKVWDVIMNWLNVQETEVDSDEEDANQTFEEAELERIDKRLNEIKRGRQKLVDFIASGSDELGEESLKDFRNKLKKLKEEEEEITKLKNELHIRIEDRSQNIHRQNLLLDAAEYYLSKAPEEITFEDKRQLLRYLVREVRVFDDEVKVFGF